MPSEKDEVQKAKDEVDENKQPTRRPRPKQIDPGKRFQGSGVQKQKG